MHAMQWPGSIPRVLFVGVPLRAAMTWIDSARFAFGFPLNCEAMPRINDARLCTPQTKSEFTPPPPAKQWPEQIAQVLVDSLPREAIARIDFARVFDLGAPP